MKNFLVLTAIRGLCRVDGGKKRPIEPGAVIALPDAVSEGLLHIGALAPTDVAPTVELIWLDDDGAARALADELRERDRDVLAAALANIGCVPIWPDDPPELKLGEATGVALIAADDRAGLVAALRELGGDAVFPGEALDRFAEKLSNAELVSELADRLGSGRLPPWELPESIIGKPEVIGIDLAAVDDGASEPAPRIEAVGAVEAPEPVSAPQPASKPVRKAKAAAK